MRRLDTSPRCWPQFGSDFQPIRTSFGGPGSCRYVSPRWAQFWAHLELRQNTGWLEPPRNSRRIRRILGERGWTRTIDPCLKRALLCQLSYAPTWVIILYLIDCRDSGWGAN